MSWKWFFGSLMVPVGFSLAVYSHMRHPWLPPFLGDLPYREAITVMVMIWAFSLYAHTRARVGRRKVSCLRCSEVYLLSQWQRRGACPACLHHEYELVALPAAQARRQPKPKPAWVTSGRRVSPLEASLPRLSLDEKRRVKGRIGRVLATEETVRDTP